MIIFFNMCVCFEYSTVAASPVASWMAFDNGKISLGETGCLNNPYFLLTGCLGIQIFDSPLFQHSQLGYLWLPTLHCAALV